MDEPSKKSRMKWWIALFLLVGFVLPLGARIQSLTQWRGPANPGRIRVAIRVTFGGWEALQAAEQAVLPVMRGALNSPYAVGDRASAYMAELGSGYRNIDLEPGRAVDPVHLARDCSAAVDAALRSKGFRCGFALCVVDDQGRTYWPGP